MEKPALLQNLKKDFGLDLQALKGSPEELMRYRWRNHYTQNERGELTGLNLRTNQLSDKIIAALAPATALEALNLSENALKSVEVPEGWAALRFLDLSENKTLTRFEYRPRRMMPLEWLDLNECALETLFVSSAFPLLKKLDVSRNQLKELVFNSACTELEMLDASNNQLGEFTLPGWFGALKYLYVNNNQIETLRFTGKLPALEILHLRDNRLENLPEILLESSRLQALYLHGNPMRAFPEGVISDDEDASSWQSVRAYWQSLGQGLKADLVEPTGQPVRNDEVKLVLLGNSTAGKSSLRLFLEKGEYDENLETTHGIINRIWQPEGKPFKVNIWDFGGQEYYHATHRLFLSNNAVTVVLFEADTNCSDKQLTWIKVYEKDEPLPRPKEVELRHFHYAYWLDNLAYFCRGEKPVCLLAQTKMDLPKVEPVMISEKDKRDYGLPDDTPRISVKGAFEKKKPFEGRFDDFRDTLTALLEKNLASYQLNARWPDIKTALRERARENPAIPYPDYVDICEGFHPGISRKQPGATVSMLDVLTNILRSTGVLLYYPDIETLAQTVFIDPEAVSEAIYKVLHFDVKQSNGRFSASRADAVADKFDPAEMLALMCEFQLIFEVRGTPGEFVAPQYLPTEKPTDKSFLKFESYCRFPAFWLRFPRYMPPSVISSFICEYGRLSADDYWKNGILFQTEDECDVLVESDGESLISVKTNRENPEQAGRWFQSFRTIVRDHPDLEISVDGENFVSLPVLLAHPAINPVIRSTTGEDLEYAAFEALLGRGQGEVPGKHFHLKETSSAPVKKKVFVSYAHADGETFKNEIVSMLTTLREQGFIEDWNDRKIEAGEWNHKIQQAVNEADIFLLLITPGFLASRYIDSEELAKAYEKYKTGKAKLFPVICDFSPGWELKRLTQMEKDVHPVHKKEMYIWLGRFQPFPKDGKPIVSWTHRNEALQDVYNSLLKEVI